MKNLMAVWGIVVAGVCSAAIPLVFPDAVEGTVTMRPEGGGDVVHSRSEPVALSAGECYGFVYEGREVGSGLLLAGSQDVNVDRHCPDESWYNFSNVFQAQGEKGGKARAERFHFGHYRGKGEFSFRNWHLVPIRPQYMQVAGLTLGHGEALVADRYTFDTCLSGFARNAARPLAAYRGASFNSGHWNVNATSEIVYRHELAGRRFMSGEVSFTCGYYRGKAGMAVMASHDGKAWQRVGAVTNAGSATFVLPPALFPAEQLQIRLVGEKGANLQISQYSLGCKVDGESVVGYGGTIYLDAETGAVFGEVKPPIFAEKISAANAQLIAEPDGVAVWGAVADVKVFRGTPVPTARAAGLKLALAANERESVQLVVNAGLSPLQNAWVAGARLCSADGKAVIEAAQVEVRRVGYVPVKTPTDETGACGDWPDPLEPQIEGTELDVKAKENQPFWITVSAPKGTRAGIYTGELELRFQRQDKARRLAVPLTVEVYDFELPDRLTCETAYGFSTRRVADFHRVKPNSFEHDCVLEKYLELFADYRLTVYHWGKGERPTVTWKNAADPAKAEPTFDWSEFDDAVAEMRGRFGHTALRVGVEGLGHGFQQGFTPGEICGVPQTNEWYQPLMGRYLGALERHLKEKGWLQDSYVYWFDEPNPSVLGQVLQGMLTLKRHAPGLRRMLTYPASKELWEGVNLWNPRLDGFYMHDSRETRARGESEFWWYICCGPHAPYPTEFIDHAGNELRTWLWMTWNEGVKGTLIWETSLWTSSSRYPDRMHPQDPYADPMAWNGRGGTWGNGDGRFVYPPRSACGPREKGAPPVMDRPNPSYRLAILRDGLEDFEYFAQLKKKDPANKLLKVPETVYRRLNDFNADPAPMREHRAKLAREIVRLGGGAPRRELATCTPAWHDGKASSYREDKWRKLRHEAKMAEIAAHGGKDYDLVLLGDSITELWEWKAPRYGANELAKLNTKLSTLALGYGGDGIQQVLWRVERGELDGYRAKNIALMIGTNNKGCKPAEMAAGIRKLLAAIKAKQPTARIALYATFPCRQTWRNLRNRAANALYAREADGKTVFFRDINAKLPLSLMPDGLHPNEAGYAVWRADLEDFCGKGAGFTLTNELATLEIDQRGWCVKLTERESGRVLADGRVPFVRPFIPGKGQLISTNVEARGENTWAWRYREAPGEAVVSAEPFRGGWTFTLRELTVPGATRVELACVRALKCCKWTGSSSSRAVSDELSGVAVRAYDLICDGSCGSDVSGVVYPNAEGSFAGGQVGFAAGPRAKWIKALQAMTIASGMPHSAAGGAWALESPQTKGSYLNANVTAASVDDWIDLARRGGFDVIHFRERWYACRGHYPVNTNDWPNGLADMKAAVAKIHAAGLRAGLHTLTGCIDPKDPWITPRCSHDLMAWRTFTLAAPLTDESKELVVEELPGPSHDVTFTYHGSGNAIRLGDEIVQYAGIRREKPYAFTGITRGAFGTVKSDHAAGEKADYLQQRYIAFYPKPDSALARELAETIGNVYRTCGFDQIYCDGAEGMFTRYAQAKMRHLILEACTRDGRPCLTEDSSGGSGPACWWFHSRVGAWDSTYWAPKRFHDFHVGRMLRQQVRERELREIQMGWWCPVEYSPHARPHTMDEMEYYAGKNAAINASMSIAGCNVSAGPLKFGVARQMTVLGWYERFRRAGALAPELLAHLAVPRAEARLRQDADGVWRAAKLTAHRHRVGAKEEAAWQVKLAEKPAKAYLRVEALYGAMNGPGAEQLAMTVVEAGSPETLAVTSATRVAASVRRVEDPEVGTALAFTASNSGDQARGAWAAAAREFRPYRAIGGRRVLTFRVKGDGSGALLNVQVKTPREYGLCHSEHYVRLDFTGWRTMEMPFRETDAEEYGDLVWPYSGGYAEVFHRAINMNNVSDVTLYLNEVPPHGSATALVTDVKLAPMAEMAFADGAVVVNGRRLAIPFTLRSGEFAELADGFWTHLDKFRTPKARVAAADELLLNAGANEISLTAGQMADRQLWRWMQDAEFTAFHARRAEEPVRAELTFFAAGEAKAALRELSTLPPESRRLIDYEAAEPCFYAPEKGFATLPPLVARPGEKAVAGFTVVGPIGPFELTVGNETKKFPAVAAGRVYRTVDNALGDFSGQCPVKVKAPAGAAARFEFVKRYDLRRRAGTP